LPTKATFFVADFFFFSNEILIPLWSLIAPEGKGGLENISNTGRLMIYLTWQADSVRNKNLR